MTGDGRSDRLIGSTPERLHVFIGVPGPNHFADQPDQVRVALPDDGEYLRLVDLNTDGKQDILIHHPSTTEPHRVVTLIAR